MSVDGLAGNKSFFLLRKPLRKCNKHKSATLATLKELVLLKGRIVFIWMCLQCMLQLRLSVPKCTAKYRAQCTYNCPAKLSVKCRKYFGIID